MTAYGAYGQVQPSENRSRTGVLVLGVIVFVLGVAILVWPNATLLVVAILFGLQLIVSGLRHMTQAVLLRTAATWVRVLLGGAGLVTAAVGVVCVFKPFVSLLTLILLVSIGWVVTGIVEIAAGTWLGSGGMRWFAIVVGVLYIGAAIAILVWPKLALLTFAAVGGWLMVFVGLYLVVSVVFAIMRTRRSDAQLSGAA